MRWQTFDPRRWTRAARSASVKESVPIEGHDETVRLAPHLALGMRGEALAALHLERAGYRLVAANFTVPVGRNRRGAVVHAEIDLIAYDGPVLCFIEVKTRASD